MKWISLLEKRFGAFAIPNLAVYLIIIQAVGAFLLLGGYAEERDFILNGGVVLHVGQWWRLLSFLMVPSVNLSSSMFALWLLISFVVFFLIGSSLEHQWGTFRFNLFILFGYLLTVVMAFINPAAFIGNEFFLGCVFLAFATLFPNFEFRLFFVIPVKVKWLGWITCAYYMLILLQPSGGHPQLIGDKLGVVAAFLNYAIFFGKDVVLGMNAARRRKTYQMKTAVRESQARHQCEVCGVTDQSDPSMHFRYCSTCGKCYCENHIETHKHE
ncbi:MAG: hypothetical protein JXR25_01020 [Pontiellaceae bacterium]|nr:hypothetical protein [Pontiellaceae bacterium]MBN2783380.1 hypothetical protein [Pontiellaceae bacterium]